MSPILGIIASAILKFITDNFNRTTTGSLGTSSSGSVWQAIRGVWYANGSAAQSDTAASSYPIASITFKADATVSTTVTEGTGVSFWVTDANSWYATVAYHTQTTYSCNCSTCCNTCQHTGGSCGTTYSCPTYGDYVIGSSCYYTDIFTGQQVYDGPATATPNTCTNADCSACGSYSCNCQTCTNNFYWLRMLKSVSGTVSQVISDYAMASLPAAVKVVTNGNTITEYGYSDAAMTTLLGSTSTTVTSPVIGAGVGIIKAPAAITQGSTVDTFSAS